MSGGMLVHTGGLVKFLSTRQKVISLSSWESQFYAAVEAIGLYREFPDIGGDVKVTIKASGFKQPEMKVA